MAIVINASVNKKNPILNFYLRNPGHPFVELIRLDPPLRVFYPVAPVAPVFTPLEDCSKSLLEFFRYELLTWKPPFILGVAFAALKNGKKKIFCSLACGLATCGLGPSD